MNDKVKEHEEKKGREKEKANCLPSVYTAQPKHFAMWLTASTGGACSRQRSPCHGDGAFLGGSYRYSQALCSISIQMLYIRPSDRSIE